MSGPTGDGPPTLRGVSDICAVQGCEGVPVRGRAHCRNHSSVPEPHHANHPATVAQRAVKKPAELAANAALICPHCQVRGQVRTQQVKHKKGVSGGKLTGAVLTGGISMLGTGLSRKEKVTEMRCGNCGTVWYV